MTPFLKWPGGKRWLAPALADIVRPYLKRQYIEPFLGGGALFFHLEHPRSVLGDINGKLIECYSAVRRAPHAVRARLGEMEISEAAYYTVRSTIPTHALDRAARFVYLNRTAFSGMYRENRRGEFNVPYGGDRTTRLLTSTDILASAACHLRKATLHSSDFESLVDSARRGDVVYCDPTYTVMHADNGFRRYNENNFSWDDQVRLATAAERAATRGAVVAISNSMHNDIAALYPDAQRLSFRRHNQIATDPARRGTVVERVFLFKAKARKSA